MLKSGRISVPVNKYKPPQPAIKIKPKPVKVVKPKTKENETDKIIDPKEYKNKDDPNNLYWTRSVNLIQKRFTIFTPVPSLV